MNPEHDMQCPAPESIAALAEGRLKRHEIEAMLQHIESCPECRTELTLANQTCHEEAQPAVSRARAGWIGLAAAAAIVVVILVGRTKSPMDELAALAPRSSRIAEPRLAGSFSYAPYRGPARAANPQVDAEQLKLDGAAGAVIEKAARDASSAAQHAAGVAYVLVGKPREAIDRLRSAALANPSDAGAWSDLSAAQYAAAVEAPSPSLLPDALASADHALRIDTNRPEALFNRALVLERLGLTQQARAAWQRYLAADQSSAWAVEARAHLAALPSTNGDALFRRELPHLESAAANDAASLAPIVRRWREQSRAWGEAEYLGRWSEALLHGQEADATRALAIARSLGNELRRQSGEALLADAVAAIDGADSSKRALLAEAHATYRRGRIAYSRQQPSAAEPDLRRAAALFARGGSPMTRMARYYAANTRFDQNDAGGARTELEALLTEEGGHPTHIASAALVRWELSRCHTVDGDVDGALALLVDAATRLQRLDERNNLGYVDSLIADTLAGAGRPDDAWSARIRSFEVLSSDGREDRLLANLASAVTAEQRAGDREAALSLLTLEREVGREINDDVLLSSTLTRNAVLRAELLDFDGARRLVDEVSAVAARITDPAFRALVNANVQFARGAATLHDDPRAAAGSLDGAIRAYEELGQHSLAIDSRLLRARAASALGNLGDAAREIDAGLDELQRFDLSLAGRAVHTGILDSGRELFFDAIRLSLDRGEMALAFGYAERSRMRFTDTPTPAASALAASVQSRLAGSGTAVLEIVLLPKETVAFCVDASRISVAREAITRDAVAALAGRVAAGDREAAAAVYDRLVRPAALHDANALVVVADPLLDGLPFAALYDSRTDRYLVEQRPIVMAESAASLRRASPHARPASVLAAALPSGAGTGSASLPETAGEIGEVAGTYSRNVVLPAARATFAAFADAARDADVIHLSGHTQDDGNGGTSALVFAGGSGAEAERLAWRTIAHVALPRAPVVMLAACDTLRLPRLEAVSALSLGGAFLAAGASDVIGTLRSVADRDARQAFCAIHRQLAGGLAPADALREMQLHAISLDRRPSAIPAWSALALLTREIPDSQSRRGPS